MVEEDADTVEAFLEAHPDSRLAREAAELLLTLPLDRFDPPETRRAVEAILATQAPRG